MQRHSIKREAILECLRGTVSHPSAEWIYTRLKPQFPDISLGTVYRNLSRFKEAGLIRSVGVVRGQERFDGNPEPHTHVICHACGSVIDLSEIGIAPELTERAAALSGYEIDQSTLTFGGFCAACAQNRGI